MTSNELILDLIERTRININQVEKLKQLPIEVLNKRTLDKSWTILECIEHLNRYSDFYNPELNQQIQLAQNNSSIIFKSGLLGNYFINSIDPDKKNKKMKTLAAMNPLGSNLSINVLEKFLLEQHELLNILKKSKVVDINKTKIKTSISKHIKLKLGDTLSFIVLHNQRHILQANTILNEVG